MNFKLIGFLPFNLACCLMFGCVLIFSTLAVAETEDPEHAKHFQQDPDSNQKSSGPLAPHQKIQDYPRH